MKVRWSARALDDRLGLVDYVPIDSPQAALHLDEAILERARQLAEMPLLGRIGRLAGTREAVVAGTRYILMYQVQTAAVRIVRVVHSAQQWPPDD